MLKTSDKPKLIDFDAIKSRLLYFRPEAKKLETKPKKRTFFVKTMEGKQCLVEKS